MHPYQQKAVTALNDNGIDLAFPLLKEAVKLWILTWSQFFIAVGTFKFNYANK